MSGGGITAAGLIVLLLALIGLGVGLYYAYICLRARPVRPRQHTDCEDGPLIAVDPDVNGNHEDVPVEASAPVDDESDAKTKLIPDGTDKGKVESNGSIDGIRNGPTKENDAVLVPIEEKPEPVKLIVEDETIPVPNVAPVGFVVPVKEIAEDGTPIHHQTPKRVEFAKQEKAEPEVHHPIHSPVPIFVPVSSAIGKKPVTDSDEEDGLLLQKCSPHDDSLERENSDISTLTLVETKGVPSPKARESACRPIDNEELNKSAPEETIRKKPEIIEIIYKPTNNIGETPSAPTEEVLSTEIYAEPAKDVLPVLMKEEVENLSHSPQSVIDIEEPVAEQPVQNKCPPVEVTEEMLTEEKMEESLPEIIVQVPAETFSESEQPENTAEPEETVCSEVAQEIDMKETEETKVVQEVDEEDAEETKVVPEIHDKVSEEIKVAPEIDDKEPKETKVVPDMEGKEPEETKVVPEIDDKESTVVIPENTSEVPEVVDYPDVVYLKTSLPYGDGEDSEVINDESKNVEKEAEVSESIKEKSTEEVEQPGDSLIGSKSQIPKEAQEEVMEIPELIVTPVSPDSAAAENPLSSQSECEIQSKTDEPIEFVVSSNVVPQASSEVSPHEPMEGIPEVSADEPPEATSEISPGELLEATSEVSADEPLEAESYYNDSVDDDSVLEMIKEEEGSVDTELESNSDTETSEPEVTQYTFASGPLVPSTKSILADELSSTLEPKVTKFSVLSDDLNAESENVNSGKESPLPDEDVDTEDSDTETEDQVSEPEEKHDEKEANAVETGAVTPLEQLSVAEETDKDEESSENETEIDSDKESSNVSTVRETSASSSQLDDSNADDEKVACKVTEKEVIGTLSANQNEQDVASSSPVPSLPSETGANDTKVPESCKDLCKETPAETNVNIQDVRSKSLSNSSSLSSSSSTSDLSDDEIVLPDTIKSKIPRLVERHGS